MSLKHQTKKRFGQNFLKDKNLLKKIVDAANIKGKNVIEIGPGLGALTQFLVVDAKKYLGFEIDLSLTPILTKEFRSDKAQFVFEDFLAADVKEKIKAVFGDEDVHLVANLPYYITTPIIFEFIKLDQVRSATIMVQKEVGQRLISSANEKSYNALSAILQYYCDVSKVVDVNRKMFMPIPNVDSMVIKLVKIAPRCADSANYEEFCKAIFKQKRKLATNNLSQYYNVSKDVLKSWLENLGFSPNIRAEQLIIEQLILLSDDFANKFILK